MGCALKLESYYENQHDWSFFEEKQRTEYKYDPVGRRISRQVTDFEDSSKSKTQKFYYDGDNILAELDESNNLTASYTHSPFRPDDILGAKFTSAAVTNNLAAVAGYVYYLKDHLNTVSEIVNGAGDIVQKMEYSAFGVLRSVKDSVGNEVGFASAPVRSSFTYTGREYEPELGMYYYRARYYDPSVGRFLQQDPDPGKMERPSSFISKYVYSGNNPAMFNDPSGMSWLSDFFENPGRALGNLLSSKEFQIFVIIAVAVVTGGAAGLAAGSWASSLAAGAFAGAIYASAISITAGIIASAVAGALVGRVFGTVAGATTAGLGASLLGKDTSEAINSGAHLGWDVGGAAGAIAGVGTYLWGANPYGNIGKYFQNQTEVFLAISLLPTIAKGIGDYANEQKKKREANP